MRRGNQSNFFGDKDSALTGINLGSDFCAEHEWGIKDLYKYFDVKHEINRYGLEKRKINAVPESLVWVRLINGREGFAFQPYWSQTPEEYISSDSELHAPYDLHNPLTRKREPSPVRLACAWDEKSFGCLSDDPADITQLREIYLAFVEKNIVLTLSKALPAFDNPGLVLAIADRLSKEVLDAWTEADKDTHEIEKYAAKSGIRELLAKAGKSYFALSPHRQKDGSIKFWLNPMEQNKNNFGWFDLEQLQQWAVNEGPIPKKI